MDIAVLFVTILTIFLLLIGCELYWRHHKTHGEISRKFIHITVGSFVASWPFFMSWGQIQILSVAFLITITISKFFNIFQAIHSVQRPTGGELFFAAAVGLTTLLTQDPYIFAAALLHMSLADGLAAIIGSRYGKTSRYYVKGQAKSLVGTGAFVITSLFILAGFGLLAGVTIPPLMLLAIATGAAAVENLGLYGSDNLLVPLLIVIALSTI